MEKSPVGILMFKLASSALTPNVVTSLHLALLIQTGTGLNEWRAFIQLTFKFDLAPGLHVTTVYVLYPAELITFLNELTC